MALNAQVPGIIAQEKWVIRCMRIVADGTLAGIYRAMDEFFGCPILLLLNMTCITGLCLWFLYSVTRRGVGLMTIETGPDRDRAMQI
jgi:hypothetical protein